jgi:myosin-5
VLSRRQIAEGILKQSGLEGYQLGTSKVFLRAGQMALLDKQRTDKLSKAAIQLQRHARGFLGRLHFKQSKEAVVRMQVRSAVADVQCTFSFRGSAGLRHQFAQCEHQTKQSWNTYVLVLSAY